MGESHPEHASSNDASAPSKPTATTIGEHVYYFESRPSAPPAPQRQSGEKVAYAYGSSTPPPAPPHYTYVYSERAEDGSTRHYYRAVGASGASDRAGPSGGTTPDGLHDKSANDECLDNLGCGTAACGTLACCFVFGPIVAALTALAAWCFVSERRKRQRRQ